MTYEPSCPVPFSAYEHVTLAHGGGGRVMQRLIEELFLRSFGTHAASAHDAAALSLSGVPMVSTDAFTVRPLFFPGGDIGSLAVHGTINDLSVGGAAPRYLTASFILEEGLPLVTLARIVSSMAAAAEASGVRVVAGDTKVVERGKGDGVFITPTGIGERLAETGPARIRPGDAILVSGPVGDHGTAVMLAREGLELPPGLVSDAAPLWPTISALMSAGEIHCMRDATRGGVATVVAELARATGLGARLDEEAIPVRPEVSDACELLGLDPLYVACEGRFVAFVPEAALPRALDALRAFDAQAALIGQVREAHPGVVTIRGPLGGERVLDIPNGEQLPRIC